VRIADYAAPDLVAANLPAADRDGVLRSLVDLLVASGRVRNDIKLMQALLKRESVMSTGIGGGIALPHALTDDVEHMWIVVARTAQPIDFQSSDAQAVDLVFMLVGPESERNLYMKLLARVSRVLQRTELKQRMRAAQRPEDILQALQEEENTGS
jgi:mannitol/fructose-specific phosphotransferase system IIA component (Ntr-type)